MEKRKPKGREPTVDYSYENLVKIIPISNCIEECAENLGLSRYSVELVRKYIAKYQLDTSHFARKKEWDSVNEATLREAVESSSSKPEVLAKLSMKNHDRNRRRVTNDCLRYNIDLSHLRKKGDTWYAANYSEENLREVISKSKSFYDCKRRLGLNEGGPVKVLKEHIEKYGIDYSHFRGNGLLLEEMKTMKSRRGCIIKERGNQCEKCREEEWESFSIPLDVHHIDKDKNNNTRENLQLLCPNCHAVEHRKLDNFISI